MADDRAASASVSPCTAYVAMLPYAYTTSDVAQLFAPFGKLARVLVLRDKQTRRSRGVAFVQFARSEDCARAVKKMDKIQLEGMTLDCSLSRDNGRSGEFAKKRKYTTSQRCFECGELGHVSYDCPRNVLGSRERPAATSGKSSRRNLKKKKKKFDLNERAHYFNDQGVVNMLYSATYRFGRRRPLHLIAGISIVSATDFIGATPTNNDARRVASHFSSPSTPEKTGQLL
ncbi:hypothetical protein BBI17_003244 [Phytophthora kernoviae]|uniref:Uncharacterized protein n=2 Tax=Phytophthora kernoviae TaxID=325452 RepID=A0A3R7IPI5_9STRA|nr:hypothetical protein G195_001137 [Phytophthora kernoviae 00238/432]KAG2529971.1 hypothetical protein JM18_002485 [Phytophthora kernoviae]RLN44722.1 hypothetical protein BBI17_003244 [Phytophthora kernoviae]